MSYMIASICLFLSCLGATHQASCLLLISLSFFFFTLNTCLAPGGFAWRKATTAKAPTAPGPTGWPLIGSIPLMGPLAHRKLADLAIAHRATRLMAFSLGTTPVVVSSHPDTAREILCGAAFSDRPVKMSARLLMFERAIGFAPSGEYWLHLRRLAASSLFSPRRIAVLEGVRQVVADEMVEGVWRVMKERGVVVVREVLVRGSLESVVGSVFGWLGGAVKKEMMDMVREGYELIGRFNWKDHFPFLGFDVCGVGVRCNRLAERVREVVGGIIQERRREGTDNVKRDDFLSLLLSLPKDELLSDADMTAVLWEMLFRGTDVVSILLEWILARMVLHPDIQSKIQQELNATVGHRPARDADVPNLRYLQAVVKETLRMHPPGPLLSWARLATRDVHVGKFQVPAGTTAMVNMWAIAHDGSIWDDPWAFRPERFMEEEVSVMGSDLRLAPFGAGRRVCPGRALGLATVHLWLARLLQCYTWIPARPVRLTECLRLSMEMKKPLVCRVVERGRVF